MNQREAWFPQIKKGLFSHTGNVYSTYQMIINLAHAVDWYNRGFSKSAIFPQYPIKTENGNFCGKIIREKVKVLDPYTIKVSHTPLYFWDGPRDPVFWHPDYGYFKNISGFGSTTFDISGDYDGGTIPANNPWPLYMPPHIYDAPVDVGDYGFYTYLEFLDDYNTPCYSHGINIYINETLISNSIIKTYDFWNGLIKFKWPINVDDNIEVTYLYEQIYAVIPDVNLNPVYPEMLYSGEYDFVEALK